jgi:DNA-binding GntR family transcriptional regulator
MSEPSAMKPRTDHEPGQARSALAYDLVRRRIAEGLLRPGEHVGESEMAQALGLSRTPVREAMKLLQAEGLLEASPGRGHTVAMLTREQASQLFYMREAIEGMAARLAATHANAAQIEAMAAALREEGALPESEPDALLAVNDRFHKVIHDAACNRYVLQAMQVYDTGMIILRLMTRVRFTPSANAHEHHVAVFQAIEREDPVAAEAAMRQHIRASRRKRLALLSGSDWSA